MLFRSLEHHIERLAEDHQHARQIGEALQKKKFIRQVLPIETNIIIFETQPGLSAKELVEKLKQKDILAYAIAPDRVRLVLHLNITPAMVTRTMEVISELV